MMTEAEELELLELENENSETGGADPNPAFMTQPGQRIPGIPRAGEMPGQAGATPLQPPNKPMQATGGQSLPPPTDPTLAQQIFPTAANHAPTRTPTMIPDNAGGYRPEMIEGQEAHPFESAMDLAALPTRFAGAALDPVLPGDSRGENTDGSRKSFGQAMANPDAGLALPAREKLGEIIKGQFEKATDEERPYIQRVGNALLAELGGAGYLGASTVEDPLFLGPLAAGSKPVKALIEKAGQGLERVGLDQMHRVVKAGIPIERKLKKPVEDVIYEYGLDKGGRANPKAVFDRTSEKIEELGKQLQEEIKAGRDMGARVDTDAEIDRVVAEFKAMAGDSPDDYAIGTEIDKIAAEFKARAKTGSPDGGPLDLWKAQNFKQYMGNEGAWEHIAKSKGIPLTTDATARSRIAEKIYHRLSAAIDEGTPDGVQHINRALSELIPVKQATGHRAIIASRNDKLSLTDVVSGAAVAANPKFWPMFALNRVSKSGTVASKIYRIGERLRLAKTSAEKARFEAALKKLGVSEDAIKGYGQAMEASAGEEAFSNVDHVVKRPEAPVPAPVQEPLPPNAVPFRAKGAPEGPAPAQPRRTLPQEANPEEGKIFDQAQTPPGAEGTSATDQAKAHYGTTPHWQKGGYMTPEGEMLNFGPEGREAGDMRRTADHSDVGRFYPEESKAKARENFIAEGNIRLHPENGGVEIKAPLTESQKTALSEWWGKAKDKTGTFKVEAGDFSRSYPNNTSPRAILKDIDDALSGKTPKAQSDMQRLRGEGDGRTLYQEDTPNTGGAASEAGLPEGRENNPKVVAAAAKAWKEKGTDSPFFRRWFGKSKVVDGAGKPQVVYHGTPRGDFDTFDASRNTSNYNLMLGDGFYLTPDPRTAEHYTHGAEGSAVIAAYLRIKNPLEVSSVKEWRDVLLGARNKGNNYEQAQRAGLRDSELLKELGYDGIVYRQNGKVREIVAFSPEQIKSATGNRGTFDPKSGNILKQKSLGQGAGPKGKIHIKRHRSTVTYIEGLADASTVGHEFGHELRARHLTDDQNATLLRIYGRKEWDVHAEEKWARNLERYFYDGKAPHKELEKAFAGIKNDMRQAYKDLKGTELEQELDPEVRLIMDAIFVRNIKIKNPDKVHRIVKAIQKGGASARLMAALKNELNDKEQEK